MPSPVRRSILVCSVGLALSGCVASSLDQGTGISPSALSLDTNPQTAAADPENSDNATTAQADPNSAMPEGITVPSTKPGTNPPAPQLALAPSSASSPSAQQAKNIATTPPKPAAETLPVAKPVVSTAKTPPRKPEKKGFFASLFSSSKKPASQRNVINPQTSRSKKNHAVKTRKVAVFKSDSNSSLPGVRKRLFGIYDAKEGAEEGFGAPVLVASAGGMARTSPNGLRIQHAGVQVACLQPRLVGIIKKVQRHYGRVPIITSGYRSPARNRKARGVRNSMHLYCKAADMQVAGVSKWALAKYLRSIPGRGGVGTYCHTKSVHIDIGTKRDWNWRCRRRKRRR